MCIHFKFRNRYYSLSIGYKTPWFEQISFITFVEEFYEDNTISYPSYARMIWSS